MTIHVPVEDHRKKKNSFRVSLQNSGITNTASCLLNDVFFCKQSNANLLENGREFGRERRHLVSGKKSYERKRT